MGSLGAQGRARAAAAEKLAGAAASAGVVGGAGAQLGGVLESFRETGAAMAGSDAAGGGAGRRKKGQSGGGGGDPLAPVHHSEAQLRKMAGRNRRPAWKPTRNCVHSPTTFGEAYPLMSHDGPGGPSEFRASRF